MKILITGATGLVGKQLVKKCIQSNHQVVILTRDISKAKNKFPQNQIEFFEWKSNFELPPIAAFKDINAIVNLMGENIGGKRWSPEQKKKLISSRVDATKNLIQQLNNSNTKLDVFVQASAIGIYPANLTTALDEDAKTTSGFLGNLCQDWENATLGLNALTRKVILRTSVVLDKSDGALKKMLPPFMFGAGGILGDGSQMMSWIHISDLVNLYYHALTSTSMHGIYNATAPNPVSNFEFTKELGAAIHRPTLFPVPAFMIKTIFGEMSAIILDSQEVISKRLTPKEFKFDFPTINLAFKEIFKR